MNIVRNILAVILGIVIGMIVNAATLFVAMLAIQHPAAYDVSSMESMAGTAHLLQPENFIGPFLAHAIGTFVGVLAAMFIAAGGRNIVASVIGVLFLLAGIAGAFIIPAPAWFIAADLIFAYLPMAFLARKITGKP